MEEESEENNLTVEVWSPALNENENMKYDFNASEYGQMNTNFDDFDPISGLAKMRKADANENVETVHSELNEMNGAMNMSDCEPLDMIIDNMDYEHS